MQSQPLRTVKKHGHLRAVATQNRVQLFDARAESRHELHQPAGPLIAQLALDSYMVPYASAISPSGKYVAAAGAIHLSIHLHHTQRAHSYETLFEPNAACGEVALCCVFCKDDRHLVALREKHLELWDCAERQLVWSWLIENTGSLARIPIPLNLKRRPLAFSPDYTLLAVGRLDGMVVVYDVADDGPAAARGRFLAYRTVISLSPHIGPRSSIPDSFLATKWTNSANAQNDVDSLCFSADGRQLIVASSKAGLSSGAISVFDVLYMKYDQVAAKHFPLSASAPSGSDVPTFGELCGSLLWSYSLQGLDNGPLRDNLSSVVDLRPLTDGTGAYFCCFTRNLHRYQVHLLYHNRATNVYDTINPDFGDPEVRESTRFVFVPTFLSARTALGCAAAHATIPSMYSVAMLPASQQPAGNRRQLAVAALSGGELVLLDLTQTAQPQILARYAVAPVGSTEIYAGELCRTGGGDDDDETAFEYVIQRHQQSPALSWMTRERRLRGREDVIFLNGELVAMHFSEEAPADGEEKAAVLLRCMLADGAQEVFKLSDEARDLYLSS